MTERYLLWKILWAKEKNKGTWNGVISKKHICKTASKMLLVYKTLSLNARKEAAAVHMQSTEHLFCKLLSKFTEILLRLNFIF